MRAFCILFFSLFVSIGWAQSKAPVFPKEEIKLGNKVIEVEVARTQEQLSYGLMYRQNLSPESGMLFVFEDQDYRSFWMKNTFVPLSIAFFDSRKTLVDIQDMHAVRSEMEKDPPSYTSAKPAQYALEMNQGWFARNKIKPGVRFEFVRKKRR